MSKTASIPEARNIILIKKNNNTILLFKVDFPVDPCSSCTLQVTLTELLSGKRPM